jgi:tRNA nucleotidyltransferase (CCA-adding enzyme)
MGLNSHDIDIALDTMMGEAFVLGMEKYMEKKGEKLRGHGKIKTNEGNSKHLETATCVIFG